MKYQIKKTSRDLKPREKMFTLSAKALRDEELLAIILGTGYKKLDVLTLSQILLKNFGLKGLFASEDPVKLMNDAGLPQVKSCQIVAISELLRRITNQRQDFITSSEKAFEYFSDLQKIKRETVRIACLTAENMIFHEETVALGNAKNVHCPFIAIFHPPIRYYGQRIIIAHNHPNGSANPSPEDQAWHKKLLHLADELEIEITDHIIIGKNDFYSFSMPK